MVSDSRKIKKSPFWLLNYSQGRNPFVNDDFDPDEEHRVRNSLSGDPLDAPVFSQHDTVEEDRGER